MASIEVGNQSSFDGSTLHEAENTCRALLFGFWCGEDKILIQRVFMDYSHRSFHTPLSHCVTLHFILCFMLECDLTISKDVLWNYI